MHQHRSLDNAQRATSYVEMRRRLRPLLKNKRLGLPAFEAYCELWERAGLESGKITITGVDLAGLIGRDVRRIRDWIDAWKRFGIVELIAFDSPTNTFHLYVDEPERAFQPQVLHAPPQCEMFGETAAETPAETPSIEASAEPRRNRREESGRQSFFWDEAGETAAETPSMVHGPIESGTIGSRAAAPAAALFKEVSVLSPGSPAETSRATAANDSAADSWGRVAAEISRRRDELKGIKPADPSDQARQQAAEKDRIRDRLKGWADGLSKQCDSKNRMATARAGQIADHVLIDGLPEAELWVLCDAVQRDWLDDRHITNPVGVFDSRLEKLLAELGVPTRSKAKRRRA